MKNLLILLFTLIGAQAFGDSVVHLPAGTESESKQTERNLPTKRDPFARAFPSSAPSKLVEFHVSKVGNDKNKLLEVFEIIRQSSKPKNEGTSFEIMQRIDERNFLVYRLEKETSAVSSGSASIGGGGGVYSRTYLRPDRTKLYYLMYSSGLDAVDGERVKDLPVTLTEEIESYTTTVGSTKSVRVYKEVTVDQDLMSREEFVERLRSGDKWIIKSYESKDCFPCGGTGRLSEFRGGGRCKDCNATGKIVSSLVVLW